jgi:hypothetical protein
MSAKIGVNCKMYVQSGGTYDSPTYTEVKKIGDANLTNEKDAVESSTRESRWKLYEGGMLDAGYEFELKANYSDAAYVLIRNAYYADGEDQKLLFLIVDADKTSNEAEGIKAYFIITKFSRNEPLSDRVTYSVELKPTEKDGNVPTWDNGSAPT